MNQWMLYVGAGIIAFWGTAHLANTRGALSNFEPMAPDTRRVAAMEWIAEGLTLAFIATLVVVLTAVSGPGGFAPTFVYRASAAMLLVMAGVSVFTGAKAEFWAYKLCPVIFSASAALFILGSL